MAIVLARQQIVSGTKTREIVSRDSGTIMRLDMWTWRPFVQFWIDNGIVTEEKGSRMMTQSGELILRIECLRLARPLHWRIHPLVYVGLAGDTPVGSWWQKNKEWLRSLPPLDVLKCDGPLVKLDDGRIMDRSAAENAGLDYDTPYRASIEQVDRVCDYLLTTQEAIIIK